MRLKFLPFWIEAKVQVGNRQLDHWCQCQSSSQSSTESPAGFDSNRQKNEAKTHWHSVCVTSLMRFNATLSKNFFEINIFALMNYYFSLASPDHTRLHIIGTIISLGRPLLPVRCKCTRCNNSTNLKLQYNH